MTIEDQVTMPKWLADLLFSAAECARYEVPANRDQVACIRAYRHSLERGDYTPPQGVPSTGGVADDQPAHEPG